MTPKPNSFARLRRRGAVAVMVALLFCFLLGIVACVVDYGLIRMWRQEIQMAVDASSHAATAQLDGTVEGMERARDMAVRIAAANGVAGEPVEVDPNYANDPAGDVVLGYWEDHVFYPSDFDPAEVTAVRVAASRSDLRTYFAPAAFAQEEAPFRRVGVSASSTALGGGPAASDCPIPIAVPDCALDDVALYCNLQTKLNPDNNDNSGWARVGSERPNANYVKNAIAGVCPQRATVHDVLALNNGAISTATSAMAAQIDNSADTWDTDLWGPLPARQACSSVNTWDYGRVVVGQIPVFHDPDRCVGTKYNGTNLPIVGFATAVVYDVCAGGAATGRSIHVRMICDLDPETQGGGGFFGTVVPPQLVQ